MRVDLYVRSRSKMFAAEQLWLMKPFIRMIIELFNIGTIINTTNRNLLIFKNLPKAQRHYVKILGGLVPWWQSSYI